jgi:hypothetical protein
MRKIGLYYPYIHFRSESWLLAAALYWPKLARIVPEGFPLRDSNDVQQLSDELGFIINVAPEPAVKSLTPNFLDLLGEYGDRLRHRYGLDQLLKEYQERGTTPHPRVERLHSMSTERPWFESPKPLGESADAGDDVDADSLAAVYVSQIDPRVREALCDLRLAAWPVSTWELGRDRDEDWVGMRHEMAWIYMCALTEEIARRNALTPVTDQEEAQAFTSGWTLSQRWLSKPEHGKSSPNHQELGHSCQLTT